MAAVRQAPALPIDPQFVMDRQGKIMVLYLGLIDAAHRDQNVQSIATEIVQIGNKDNDGVTVVKARVTLKDGRFFDGVGDASPANVGRNIAPHSIRMAETRAKGRALRDALNVAAVTVEELGDIRGDEGSDDDGDRLAELRAAYTTFVEKATAQGCGAAIDPPGVGVWDDADLLEGHLAAQRASAKAAYLLSAAANKKEAEASPNGSAAR